MMTLETYNEWHLGDCILQLLFLRRLSERGHDCRMYVQDSYLYELSHYSGTVKIDRLIKKPKNAVNCWLGRDNGKFFSRNLNKRDYVQCMLDLYSHLANVLKVKNPVVTKDDIFLDWPEIKEECVLTGKADIFLVNSSGRSNQGNGTRESWQRLADKLSNQGYRVVTTAPLNGHECTLLYGLNLAQVGNVSIGAKVVAGVQTGPLHPTFNIWTRDRGAYWLNLHAATCFAISKKVTWVKNFLELEIEIMRLIL